MKEDTSPAGPANTHEVRQERSYLASAYNRA